MAKNQKKHLLQILHRLTSAVNKYDIQDIEMDLNAYSGSKLALILPEMIALFKTASIRYTLSALAKLIIKTGHNAREAFPILIDKLLTNDEWLISGYRYSLEQLGWTYKDNPDELDAYIKELELIIEADDLLISNRETLTRQLATQVEDVDIPITHDDVLALLDLRNAAISSRIYDTISWSRNATDEMKNLAVSLSNLTLHINRQRTLQRVIATLHEHNRTGWQSHEKLYTVIAEFLKSNPLVKQIIIFGSRANKTYRADSDLDIALVLKATNPEEALAFYRQHNAAWHAWFTNHLPYEIDLNLYIDETNTPEIHNALKNSTHSTYG